MASSLFKLEWQEACFLVLEQAYKGWRQNATFVLFVKVWQGLISWKSWSERKRWNWPRRQ